jgi:hypothetical protein
MKDFKDAGSIPLSLVAFHSRFLQQVRDAFVAGAYYPALIGACTLGERILNHLLLALRDDFQRTAEYRKVHAKKSFQDWDLAISTLTAWDVLLADAAEAFSLLRDVRHQSVHFRPEIDTNDRDLALKAIRLLHTVVRSQFSAFGPQPWFIPTDIGIPFIRREWEDQPFVRRVILPCCKKVGPAHRLVDGAGGAFEVQDDQYDGEREVADEEYIALFIEAQRRNP